MNWLLDLDKQWFQLINLSGSESWDGFMLWVTHKLTWIPLYLFLILKIIKQYGNKSISIFITIGMVVALCDLGSVHFFKNVFQRLRPCHVLEHVRLVTEGCGGQYGFISSHASNVFGLAIVIGKIINQKILFVSLFLWAVLVSFSRVYVGVHYPLDIVGGMLWGTFVALVCLKIYNQFLKK